MDKQVAGSFDKVTLKKIGKGILITSVGAGLTYLAQYLSSTDFGEWTPVAVIVGAMIVNAVREYNKGI